MTDTLLGRMFGDPTVVRVAGYVRISTDEKHQPFSLGAQQSALTTYVASQPGWVLTGPIYVDEASGAGTDRPGLRSVLAAVKAGSIDVLLVHRVDRLARSLRGLVDILDDLACSGVGLRSVTEPVDTGSPVGRLLVQMLGLFAQFEREVIIDRVISGMERKAIEGRWTGGTRPYGYQVDAATDRLVPHPDEAPTLRRIFRLYADRRAGTRVVAEVLNGQGLRNSGGRLWSGATIARILTNRVYLGEKTFRSVTKPGAHEPLIDADLFARAGRIMAGRGEATSRRAAPGGEYLLTGLVSCGLCGSRFVGCAATGRTARYRYYICARRARHGRRGCDGARLRADHLEQAVLTTIASSYSHTRMLADATGLVAADQAATAQAQRHERAAVNRQIDDVRHRIQRYLTAFETAELSPALCGDRLTALAAQLDQLCRYRTCLNRPTRREAYAGDGDGALRQHIDQAIATADHDPLRDWIQFLIADIRVTGHDHIQPYLRKPPGQAALVPPWRGASISGLG